MAMIVTLFVLEFRHRRPGKNKNGVRLRWSPWRIHETYQKAAAARTDAKHIRTSGRHGLWELEYQARVVPFDRRRR
jgi:hypothetical protein